MFEEVVSILNNMGFKVLLIDARALEKLGVQLDRITEDWDVIIDRGYLLEVRDAITDTFRRLGYNVQWRKWGIMLEKQGNRIDINYAPLIFDEDFVRRSTKINNIYLPSIEDLIILKMMSGESRDIKDVKKAVRSFQNKLDMKYLMQRAEQAGIEKAITRLLKSLQLYRGGGLWR